MRDSDVDSLMKLHQYSAEDSFEEYKQALHYNTITTRPPNKIAMGQDPKKNRGILTSPLFSNSQKLGFLQKMNTLNSKTQIGSKKYIKPGSHDIHVISRRKNFQSYNELFQSNRPEKNGFMCFEKPGIECDPDEIGKLVGEPEQDDSPYTRKKADICVRSYIQGKLSKKSKNFQERKVMLDPLTKIFKSKIVADQGMQAKMVRRKSVDNSRILRSSQKNKKVMQAEGVLNFWEICYELIIRTQLSQKLASGDEDLDRSQFLIPDFLKRNKLADNKAMRVLGLMEADQSVTSKVCTVSYTNSIVGNPAMGTPRMDGILKLKSTPPDGIDTPDNLKSVLEAEISKSQRILPARDENPKSSTFLR
jgi:hypothetical protein